MPRAWYAGLRLYLDGPYIVFVAQVLATSMSGSGTTRSDQLRMLPAMPVSPASSRDLLPAAGSVPPVPCASSHDGSGMMVCNTRRSLGAIVADPMARACCNALLAGYANATPALGNRASMLLQILKECAPTPLTVPFVTFVLRCCQLLLPVVAR